ncbi:MAG: amidohydrolase family protein [Anaerolineales bacterium]|nr:amidohydrolase family protein [Anaerolineales bacterium]
MYTEFQEHIKGQLRPGYLADFVLLSADVFSLPPEALLEVRPLLTICDGEIVFEA